MAVKPIPEGFRTVTPFAVVPDIKKALDFVKTAFDAKVEAFEVNGEVMHADAVIGDSHMMFGPASKEYPTRPATVYLYHEDVDGLYRKAINAGAKSLREPTNEFYGDRSGGVVDPQGNQWWIATHVEDVSKDELDRRGREWSAQQQR